MYRLIRGISIIALLIVSVYSFNTSAFSWTAFVQTNELFAVGVVKGTEKSYLYKIDPLTGEFELIGDTGLNNCRGLDFNPERKLKVFCEYRGDAATTTSNLVLAGTPVVAELNVDDGGFDWAVPHGLSNYISDITIHEDGRLFSYENLDQDKLHRHEEDDDFQAQFIGSPGLEAFDHGLAAWGAADLKIFANVNSTPSMYTADSETGNIELIGALSFPDDIVLVTMEEVSTRAAIELIEFASVDSTRIAGVDLPGTNALSTAAIGYAFEESEADFAALMFKSDLAPGVMPETANRVVLREWAAVGLVDFETRNVDYVVELQEAPVVIDAIAVREIPARVVPALSEWGFGITAALLLAAGVLYYRRKNGLSS